MPEYRHFCLKKLSARIIIVGIHLYGKMRKKEPNFRELLGLINARNVFAVE